MTLDPVVQSVLAAGLGFAIGGLVMLVLDVVGLDAGK